MPSPSRKKKREETKSNEELALIGAMNSNYNLMHPMLDAENVRVRNPLTGLDPTFRTDSDSFRDLIGDLCKKGLDIKLAREFDFFADNYNPKWAIVKDFAMSNHPQTEGNLKL